MNYIFKIHVYYCHLVFYYVSYSSFVFLSHYGSNQLTNCSLIDNELNVQSKK